MMSANLIQSMVPVALVVLLFTVVASVSKKVWDYAICYLHFELGGSGFPRGPPTKEVLQGLKRGDAHRVFVDWVNNKYGPLFWYRLFGWHVVAITDPWLVREVLSRPEDFEKPHYIYRHIEKMTGPHGHHNLLSSPTNDHWRLIRKGIMPAFSIGNIKKGFHHIQKACSNLVSILNLMITLSPNTVLNMEDILARESMDVIGRIGFGRDMGATKNLEKEEEAGQALEIFVACRHEITEDFKDPMRQLKFWKKSVREGKEVLAAMHTLMGQLLEETMENEEWLEENSMAAHLLAIRDPKTGARLPFETLLPEVSIFFIAGYDTTGHTMSWALYLLSQHPEVEAKVVSELARHGLLAGLGKPRPRLVQWSDLSKLTYLNAVIKESQRLYSVGANIPFKYALRKATLGGGKYTIPKGTMLVMPIQTLHCSKYNWDKPYDFIPERWLESGTELARHIQPDAAEPATAMDRKDGTRDACPSGTEGESNLQEQAWEEGMTWDDSYKAAKRYLPFSEGARSCAGMSLAKVNLTACLATLLGHFKFRLAEEMGGPEGVRRAEQLELTVSCKNGMKMQCELRRKKLSPA